MEVGRIAKGLGLVVACVVMAACAGFEESGFPGSASSMAHNQMMLVRRDPATFGYYRLGSLTRIYPDLAFFIETRGTPDFLAETESDGHDYYILYYLEKREAFACRTRPGRSRGIEFAGPYPVTEWEYRTLSGFREGKDP